MQHEALLAPVGRARRVRGGAEQDLVVGWIFLAAPKLHVEEATEAIYWPILEHVHVERCLPMAKIFTSLSPSRQGSRESLEILVLFGPAKVQQSLRG